MKQNLAMNKEWEDILVYLEYHYGIIHPISPQLIGKSYELALSAGKNVYGVMAGKDVYKSKDQLKGFPLKKVFLYETEDEYFRSDLYEELITDCIYATKPSVFLIGATPEGRALAPRIAARFKTGLTADCTELLIREYLNLVQIRPAFGGDIMAQIITPNARPQLATLRYGAAKSIEPVFEHRIEFINITKEKCMNKIEVINSEIFHETKGIAQQDILVVAGKGIRKKEDLSMLEELAKLLGGELASTRGLVEKGWIPIDKQIGLSGQTVKPKLLITCGVSGSLQFLAGIGGADLIIAINTDKNAKIFNIAHCPICGDLYEIVPELIKLIKNGQNSGLLKSNTN
ncbi:electron transfer flavoprotein subunit alpha/FixB family protein [Tepidanaerobacter syntrophicus]|uniref:electron transfer flavoprotein subunit alpha/FixB family protein n=1 Tax=Tepidanaerobacter syntrophicus TaxID=224999 RepID=UPI001BD20C18|nr:electron transfer flavoprotein subunit alpha/FixB family protein [Tepidanaerobacter syntrophicus]